MVRIALRLVALRMETGICKKKIRYPTEAIHAATDACAFPTPPATRELVMHVLRVPMPLSGNTVRRRRWGPRASIHRLAG